MTTTPETPHQPTGIDAAKLYMRVRKARLAAARAADTLAQAAQENADAHTYLTALEAEYQAVKAECVA